MSSNTRIYVVKDHVNSTEYLVEAGSQAQAINHVVRQQFAAGAARPADVARLMANGATLEKAGENSQLGLSIEQTALSLAAEGGVQ